MLAEEEDVRRFHSLERGKDGSADYAGQSKKQQQLMQQQQQANEQIRIVVDHVDSRRSSRVDPKGNFNWLNR